MLETIQRGSLGFWSADKGSWRWPLRLAAEDVTGVGDTGATAAPSTLFAIARIFPQAVADAEREPRSP